MLNKFFVVSAAGFCTLMFVLFGVFYTNRQPIETINDLVNPAYMPGNEKPGDAECYYENYAYYTGELDCYQAGNRDISIAYSNTQHEIIETLIMFHGQFKIGTLLLSWGDPICTEYTTYGTYIYWPGRYAYVNGHNFSPFSKVSYLAYVTRKLPSTCQSWQGFR